MERPDTIIHVCMGGERNLYECHFYFGSIAAIFDVFTPDELGITKEELWQFHLSPDNPFRNEKCSIFKGKLNRKKQLINRG
jgi:hypothetical protein